MMKTATFTKKRRRFSGRRVETTTDEQLLRRYRETGDRELFAKLVHRYERELFNYLSRYLGSAEMAEDVFQAAFLQVHLKCDQFKTRAVFGRGSMRLRRTKRSTTSVGIAVIAQLAWTRKVAEMTISDRWLIC